MPWRMQDVPLCSPFPFLCQAENWQMEPSSRDLGGRGEGLSLGLPSVLPIEPSVVLWPLMDEEGFCPNLPPWAKGGPRALWLSVLPSPSGLGPSLQRGCVGRARWAGKEAEASPLLASVSSMSSALPFRCRSFHLAVPSNARSRGVPARRWLEPLLPSPRVPGCHLRPPPPLSEEQLGRHIYALCITFPTALHTFPLGLDSVVSGPRFWSSLHVSPFPSCFLLQPPLGFVLIPIYNIFYKSL